jgi:prepilin-type N-terminal cleavage/methylation domain-containing protein
MSNRTSQRGFTLIEVMLAVAIMSVSALALLLATSQCLAVASRSRKYHDAVSILDRGELEHPLIVTNEVYENAVREITYPEGYTFARTVEETEEDEDLFIVRTRVTWSAKGKTAFEEVAQYLYSTNHP